VKSADFVGSLPLRRENQFLTLALAGIVCTWLADLVVFLLAVGIEAANGLLLAGRAYLFQLLAISSFAVVVVEGIVREIMQRLVFGLQGTGLVLQFLSPPAYLLDGINFIAVYGPAAADGSQDITGSVFGGWLCVGIYAAAGVLFLLAALALYRRRRMETAGDFVALRVLKPVFKYCLAVGCALVLCYILSGAFYNGDTGTSAETLLRVLGSLLAGAFLGYFAAEMLIRKSFRVFGSSWRGFAVTAVVLAALTVACDFNVFGVETRRPDTAGVSRAGVNCDNGKAVLTSGQGIADTVELQSGIVSHKKEHEDAEAHGEQVTYVSLIYYDTDDNVVMRRRYYIDSDSTDLETLRALVNSPEAVENRLASEIPLTEENIGYAGANFYDPERQSYQSIRLSAEEACALYEECLLPDLTDSSLGYLRFYPDDYENDTAYAANIEIDLRQRQPDGSYVSDYIEVTVTMDAARTIAWMRDHGIPLVSESERDTAENTKYLDIYPAPAMS
jgi:ABC-2 type transport system permease protein